ncbi:sulfite exporter TauE/SafE family protein [candidate division KSB1 bacterium]|nr:sulfite exporter TauE/SafE family protein [candidate division KSB1 bacterium]
MWLGIGSAIWLGILTSISPCPLATNIAAVSYIGRRVAHPLHALGGGLLYSLGRIIAYVGSGALVSWSVLSIPRLSMSLQSYMSMALGPLLVLIGLVVTGWIPLRLPGSGRWREQISTKATTYGWWGPLLLGIIFALSFCPVSAALFFGSLIPLSAQYESLVLLPLVYGLGTALPVIAVSFTLAYSVHALGRVFNALTKIERWSRLATGLAFMGIGLYLAVRAYFPEWTD